MNWPAARRALFGGNIPGIRLSGSSFAAASAQGTAIGTLSAYKTTGTPTWGLVSNAGGRVQLSGAALQVGPVASVVGDSPLSVTVSVSGVTPTLSNKVFAILVLGSSYVPTYYFLGF